MVLLPNLMQAFAKGRGVDENLDCWPSGKFCEGLVVPPPEQATMIFESLASFDSTPGPKCVLLVN